MLKENVSQIGTDFKMEDMLIDLVEPCHAMVSVLLIMMGSCINTK